MNKSRLFLKVLAFVLPVMIGAMLAIEELLAASLLVPALMAVLYYAHILGL